MPVKDLPPPDPTPWEVGDLALCTRRTDWISVGRNSRKGTLNGPAKGSVHRVTAVYLNSNTIDGVPVLTLKFEPWPRTQFHSACFRKIEPLSELEKQTTHDLLPV